jgi:hypothetical protein
MSDRPAAAITCPSVPGVLSGAEVLASAWWIAELQHRDGMVPWFAGGHGDPWNHVEAAMALTTCGLYAEAERAYRWLAATQLGDGSWFNYYRTHGVEDTRLDTNVCAYVATGSWHHYLVTADRNLLEVMWPVVEAAMGFVLRCQRADGPLRWSIDGTGRPQYDALLTGSSSAYLSMRCAVAMAQSLGRERPDWELAAGRLGHAVAHHAPAFADKDEFAMDWYYPVLVGAIGGRRARERLERGWHRFVMDERGVRCVSTRDWVTAAETAECAISLHAAGMVDEAHVVLAAGQSLRLDDGSYWTGLVHPEGVTFPGDERTTYSAAAMVLAADALADATPASGLFRGMGLGAPLDLAEPSCDATLACTAAG